MRAVVPQKSPAVLLQDASARDDDGCGGGDLGYLGGWARPESSDVDQGADSDRGPDAVMR